MSETKGKYDHIFHSDARSSETLDLVEAITAVGILLCYADGQFSNLEQALVDDFLEGAKVFLERDRRKLTGKLTKIARHDTPGALFNAAKETLQEKGDFKWSEKAYALAVYIAIGDDRFCLQEKDTLDALGEALHIPSDRVRNIKKEIQEGDLSALTQV